MKGRMLLVLLFSHLVGWGVEGTIDTVEYVNFKPENWQGKEDLSFTYKLEIVDNAIELTVDVTDQTVILKDGDSIVSDHVELWLFDPAILEEVQNFKKGLDNTIAERKDESFEYKPDPSTAGNDEVLKLLQEQYANIGKVKYVHQYIFNHCTISTYPSFKLNRQIKHFYTPTATGYTFHLHMPLIHSLSLKSGEIKNLGFLVSLSDVDSKDVTKQDKLMSSGKEAKFNRPETFNNVVVDLKLNLDDPAMFYQSLNPEGVFYLTNTGYEYYEVKWLGFFGSDSGDVGELPVGYQKLEPKFLTQKDNLIIRFYFENLIFERGFEFQLIDLKDVVSGDHHDSYELLDFQEKEGFYYLLLSTQGFSRWPGGTNFCGAGFEQNMVFITLDKDLNVIDMESVLLDSCLEDRESKKKDNAGKISYQYGRIGEEWTVEYDLNQPKEGLKTDEPH